MVAVKESRRLEQAILTSTLFPFCCALFYFFVVGDFFSRFCFVLFFCFFVLLFVFLFLFLLFFIVIIIFSEAISIGNRRPFIKICD